jgi:ribosomal protein S18 acetylase RimI-like enzyme
MQSLSIVSMEDKYLPFILESQMELYLLNYPDTVFDESFFSMIFQLYSLDCFYPRVAVVDDEPIGFYLFDDKGYLLQIFISSNYRKKGIGKWLMAHFEDEVKQRGGDRTSLHVSALNDANQSMYTHLGYTLRPDESHPNMLVGTKTM